MTLRSPSKRKVTRHRRSPAAAMEAVGAAAETNMALIYKLDAATRKLLARSRNRIASLFIPEPPERAAALQNAAIDIMEPLTIGSGRSQNVAFRYITGEPAATAFGMQRWASERDARNGLPPLTQNQERPSQVFLPEVPQPNTGEFQDGIVAITVPEIHVAEEDFFWQNNYLSSVRKPRCSF